MRRGVFSLMLLTMLFSFLFCVPVSFSASLDSLVYKLEVDLKSGKSSGVIREDVAQIEKKKKSLPVIHIPELNYLLQKNVEPVPSSKLSIFESVLCVIQPIKVYSTCGLAVLSLFTVLFFFQQFRKSFYLGQLLVFFFSVLMLFLLFGGNYVVLTVLFAFCGVLLFSFRKWRFVYFYSALFVIFLGCAVGGDFLKYMMESPAELFTIKVNRDWYAPDFLVEKAFASAERQKIEKLSNRISWGNYTVVLDLEKLLKRANSKEERAVLLNNLGVVYFMKGKLEKARNLFAEALREQRLPIIEYNLFLTRSALLDTTVRVGRLASKIGNLPLIAKGIPIPVHLNPSSEEASLYVVVLPYLLCAFLGFGLGVLILKFVPVSYGFFREDVLRIPGSVSFVNAELRPFVVIPLFVTAVNFLLGVLMCS